MDDTLKLKVRIREERGSRDSRRLRRAGEIPANLAHALGAPRLEVTIREGIEFTELAVEQILQLSHVLQGLRMGTPTFHLIDDCGGKSHPPYPMCVEGLDEEFTGLAAPG